MRLQKGLKQYWDSQRRYLYMIYNIYIYICVTPAPSFHISQRNHLPCTEVVYAKKSSIYTLLPSSTRSCLDEGDWWWVIATRLNPISTWIISPVNMKHIELITNHRSSERNPPTPSNEGNWDSGLHPFGVRLWLGRAHSTILKVPRK